MMALVVNGNFGSKYELRSYLQPLWKVENKLRRSTMQKLVGPPLQK